MGALLVALFLLLYFIVGSYYIEAQERKHGR